jgi:hypothetical protein
MPEDGILPSKITSRTAGTTAVEARPNSCRLIHLWLELLQVVTLSVYTYFIAALMGRQFILSDTDMFFPFFTVLQVSAGNPSTPRDNSVAQDV